jgi:hypothetical protein
MPKKKRASEAREKVPESVPRVHEAGAGISEQTARQLDLALHQMESGNPDGSVVWDESSETIPNLRAAEIGTSSHSAHRGISSNTDMLFSAMVQREKNADPDIEHDVAYDRAVDKFNAMQDADNPEEK